MKLPLFSKIYPLEGGSAWDFEVCAVYVSRRPTLDESTIFFHWEYLDEVRTRLRASGYDVGEQDVAIFWVRVKDGHEPQAVLEAVDALYASGPQRVRTLTESMFQAQFASMLGNVPTLLLWIGGAVVFAIFFSVLNTTQMAARERSRDVGILKALGFPDALAGRLLLLESMFVVGSGGLLGVLLGGLSEGMFRGLFGLLIPNYYVEARTLALGVLLALAIGIVGGILPSIRLARLRTVDVLREEG
jgi:putative ABC transport system permease protein